MSVVAKIIYVSRKLSPGVSPGRNSFLYDKNNNLYGLEQQRRSQWPP